MPSAEGLSKGVDTWIAKMGVAVLTSGELDALLEYSTTIPTGKTIGKQWKRHIYLGDYRGQWLRGEYTEDPDPQYVAIDWKRVIVKEET